VLIVARQHDRPLRDSGREVMTHLARRWRFGLRMESVNAKGEQRGCGLTAPVAPPADRANRAGEDDCLSIRLTDAQAGRVDRS
jgi:hypothetical protein